MRARSEARAGRSSIGRAAALGDRLLRTIDLRRSATARPLPRVQVELGPSISGLAAHVAVAALGMGCVALLNPRPLLWAVAAVAAALMAARPAPGAAALFGAAVGLGLAYQPVHLLSVRPFGLLLLVPAMVTLGAASQSLPRHARLEWAALIPAARRFALIQLGAQALALALALASRRGVEAMWVAVAGAAACAGAAWALRAAIRAVTAESAPGEPGEE
ncbi:MAG: hypothetical protein LBQ06_01945 [Frankiaceae bacterium]|jgi:hypothetical protein|nr:hypothetical protein [Frankiaceae bacterium]